MNHFGLPMNTLCVLPNINYSLNPYKNKTERAEKKPLSPFKMKQTFRAPHHASSRNSVSPPRSAARGAVTYWSWAGSWPWHTDTLCAGVLAHGTLKLLPGACQRFPEFLLHISPHPYKSSFRNLRNTRLQGTITATRSIFLFRLSFHLVHLLTMM